MDFDVKGVEFRQELNKDKLFAYEIKVGLKVEVRESVLKTLQEHNYIKANFKLNIKRLNRWWYSVYFAQREESNYN